MTRPDKFYGLQNEIRAVFFAALPFIGIDGRGPFLKEVDERLPDMRRFRGFEGPDPSAVACRSSPRDVIQPCPSVKERPSF